ncbi:MULTISPECIES: hypothetical protein [Bradyrhizobium]|uniref:hypothetical protein n=1 Tax=Bradyrhizobium TaxID=374 RepID=UPI001EDB24BA|nr:hypothetical protein [Bradyrhizobium zhengyangense]MCG2645664.1 hypothetical protein [Bradyrhizobium zhengyangense]
MLLATRLTDVRYLSNVLAISAARTDALLAQFDQHLDLVVCPFSWLLTPHHGEPKTSSTGWQQIRCRGSEKSLYAGLSWAEHAIQISLTARAFSGMHRPE